MPAFRVLLNCVDHYQATPTELDPQFTSDNNGPQLRSGSIKVPVIRVFGATETGQKVCAHIHGALPYLYLEYKGSLDPAEVNAAIRSLHASIDHALALSYRRNPSDHSTAFVAYISLVKGIPFYGYYVGYRYYFKVYLLNPLHMTRLADLLLQGAVMKRALQPYESHLQFIPQWMCDYSLHGCTFINCSKVKFRPPVPSYTSLENPDHLWHDESIPQGDISDRTEFPRQSHCAIEVDIHVQDILNRHEIRQRDIHHDFVVESNEGFITEKLVPSLRVLWKDEERRRKAKLGLTGSEGTPFSQKDLASMSSDPRQTLSGGWIHEQEFREQIDAIVAEERRKRDNSPTRSDFVRHPEFHELVKTALESVQELYPQNLLSSQADAIQSQISTEANNGNVEVDENRIGSFGVDTFFDTGDIDDSFVQDYQELEDVIGRKLVPNAKQPNKSEPLDPGIFLQSSQLEEVGIKRASDPINSDSDLFEIDPEFLTLIDPNLRKRDRNEETSSEESRDKKAKMTGMPKTQSSLKAQFHVPMTGSAHETIIGKGDSSTSDSPASSQKPRASGGDNQRLPFPVVKDPTNAATMLRLSQQNQQAKKTQETFKKEGILPEGNTSQSNTINPPNEVQVEPATTNSQDGSENVTSYQPPKASRVYCFTQQCPLPSLVRETISDNSRPSVIYQGAYYGNDGDALERAREYAGKEFKLESNSLPFLPTFDPTGTSPAMFGEKPALLLDRTAFEEQNKKLRRACSLRTWEFAAKAPIQRDIADWFEKEEVQKNRLKNASADATARDVPVSQIDASTQHNKHGFKYSQRTKSSAVQHEANYMSVMSLEVHVNTRGTLAPNPE